MTGTDVQGDNLFIYLADGEMAWLVYYVVDEKGIVWNKHGDFVVPGHSYSGAPAESQDGWQWHWTVNLNVPASGRIEVETFSVKGRNYATATLEVTDNGEGVAKGYQGAWFTEQELTYYWNGIKYSYPSGRRGDGPLNSFWYNEVTGVQAKDTRIVRVSYDCGRFFGCLLTCPEDSDSSDSHAPEWCISAYAPSSFANISIISGGTYVELNFNTANSPLSESSFTYVVTLQPRAFRVEYDVDGSLGKVVATPCNDRYALACSHGYCETLDDHGNGYSIYESETEVSVSAIPTDDCYEFDHFRVVPYLWDTPEGFPTGDHYENPMSFSVPTASCSDTERIVNLCSVHAYFKLKSFTATADVAEGEGDVSVGYNSTSIDVECGRDVVFGAIPGHCYRFLKWVINEEEYDEPYVRITIIGQTYAHAYFKKRKKKTEGDGLNYDPDTGKIIYGCYGEPIYGQCMFLTEEEEKNGG